jgi:RimJ/RimL family protein N-acetyltransferase
MTQNQMTATTARIAIEPLDLETHMTDLHRWLTHPRSVYWGMLISSIDDIAAAYRRVHADPHHHAHLGRVDGAPQFLVETYDPAHSELAGTPELSPTDVGMHLLVAPPDTPQHGFTREVFSAVMRFCFTDPTVERVVVEPDVRNQRIAALNAAAGFVVAREITLSAKTAALSFCTRDAFASSELGDAR